MTAPVSTASLIIGVVSAGSAQSLVLIAGLAGLLAGAMSMAAGEYVSVSSQANAETADLAREALGLRDMPEAELDELTGIYAGRGLERALDRALARLVAIQLTAANAPGAHARDELGMSETVTARPLQAAVVSALSLATGAAVPLAVAWLAGPARVTVSVALTSLMALAALGAITGGTGIVRAALRVTVWGALAMVATAMVGMLFGVAV